MAQYAFFHPVFAPLGASVVPECACGPIMTSRRKRKSRCLTCVDTPTKNKVRGAVECCEMGDIAYSRSKVASCFGVTMDQLFHMLASSSERTHDCTVEHLDRKMWQWTSRFTQSSTLIGDSDHAYILDLPVELIELILEHLSTAYLINASAAHLSRTLCKGNGGFCANVFH